MAESAPITKGPNLIKRLLIIITVVVVFVGSFLVVQIANHKPDYSGYSKIRRDMRSFATAIETYRMDFETYPIAVPLKDYPIHNTFYYLKKNGKKIPIVPTVDSLVKQKVGSSRFKSGPPLWGTFKY
jgi:hypothetical protein